MKLSILGSLLLAVIVLAIGLTADRPRARPIAARSRALPPGAVVRRTPAHPGAPGTPPASANTLVVRCGPEVYFAEPVLREFEQRTGIALTIQRDEDRAIDDPALAPDSGEGATSGARGDVLLRGGPLLMMELARRGALESYKGQGFERIGYAFKDPEGRWAGFAGRLRVWMVDTDNLDATPQAIEATLAEADLSRVALPRPVQASTLLHYTVLWEAQGAAAAQRWHSDTRRRHVTQAAGNAAARDLVLAGSCDLALTNSDQFFLAKADQPDKALAMLPVTIALPLAATAPTTESSAESPVPDVAICVPSAVAIVRGTRRLDQARLLVDYLLSDSCELALARSQAHLIPLGAIDESSLPEEVRPLRALALGSYPILGLSGARAACAAWLRTELGAATAPAPAPATQPATAPAPVAATEPATRPARPRGGSKRPR